MNIIIEQIKQKVNEVTPGNWVMDSRVGCVAVYADNNKVNCMGDLDNKDRIYYQDGFKTVNNDGSYEWNVHEQHLKDATFIADSKYDMLYLIELIEELEQENKLLKSRIGHQMFIGLR